MDTDDCSDQAREDYITGKNLKAAASKNTLFQSIIRQIWKKL